MKKPSKTWKLIWRHVLFLGAVAAMAAYGCPIYEIWGISCPLCGTTRAWISCLKGQIGTAFRYHPLFFVTPFWFWAVVHYDSIFRKNKLLGTVLVLIAVILVILNLLRLCGGTPL